MVEEEEAAAAVGLEARAEDEEEEEEEEENCDELGFLLARMVFFLGENKNRFNFSSFVASRRLILPPPFSPKASYLITLRSS